MGSIVRAVQVSFSRIEGLERWNNWNVWNIPSEARTIDTEFQSFSEVPAVKLFAVFRF
jgi:hypothetical protein